VATTTGSLRARRPIPSLPWIVGGTVFLVVALMVSAVVLLLLGLRESPSDKLAKEFLSTVAPKSISSKNAWITPGLYSKPSSNATDGAEVVASFYLFASQGKVEEAMKLAADPNLRAHAGFVAEDQDLKKSIEENKGIFFNDHGLGLLAETSSQGPILNAEPLARGRTYLMPLESNVSAVLGVAHCVMWMGTGWKITICP